MSTRPQFIAGFSKADISPPLSKRDTTPILGFWWERAKRWEAVHDPLCARAAFIEGADGPIAIVSADMIGDAVGFGDAARTRIAQELRISQERVMVACVHAHTTPETIGLSGFEPDPDWLDSVANNIFRVVAEARGRGRPVTLRTAAATLDGVTCNRRLPVLQRYDGHLSPTEQARAAELDTEVRALWAEDQAGRVVGVVVNFACHPVAVQTLPLLSADIPGHAMAKLERGLGADTVCLFLNGADGDVNPLCERSFEGVACVGDRIADAALDVMRSPRAETIESLHTSGRSMKMSLVRKPTRALEELAAEIDRLRRDAGDESGGDQKLFAIREEMALAQKPEHVPVEVQVLQIGALRVAGVPGELLCSLGRDIKAGAMPTMVVSYANGYVGYICPRLAFKLGGYEVGCGRWSLLAEGGGERIRDAAIELLTR